jgi:hypothetical protein
MPAITDASKATMDLKVKLVLTEQEARALYAITVYGPEPFLKWYYERLGRHYMSPYESGIKSLFTTVRNELPQHFSRFDKIKKYIKENL